MRNLLFSVLAALGLGLSLSVYAAATHSANASAGPADARQLVAFPPPLRARFLGNMRGHLASLTRIEAALADGQFDTVADLAEQQLGMTSMARHGAGTLGKYMPAGMKRIGSGMHHAASRLALTAQNASVTSDTNAVLTALTDVTSRCVACHAAYRLHR